MKKPRETALRWFRQAEHDLTMAGRLEQESPADARYFAEQASQKCLKAFLYFRGERNPSEHSVAQLARRCSEKDPEFDRFIMIGTAMDQYYIPTRYPDALPDPAVPFESYSGSQSAEAVRLASEMVELVKRKIQEAE